MEVTKFWTEHKQLIIKTTVVVAVGLLLVRFFDFVLLGSILVAFGVAAALGWRHLSEKHGGVWKALLGKFGVK